MKKLIILAAILIASQALAADEEEVSPEKIKANVKETYLRCNMKDAVYSSTHSDADLKNLQICKKEIDGLIIKAVNGDDPILAGLEDAIHGETFDDRHMAFNNSFMEKLQIEAQRSLKESQAK